VCTLAEFAASLQTVDRPVVLLEGKRDVPDAERASLVALAELLARRLPDVIFRSGNATGSDLAFAEGVARVDASRLELFVPYDTHRKAQRPAGSRASSLRSASPDVVKRVAEVTAGVSPTYQRLVTNYREGRSSGRASGSAELLMRDTMKVLGDPVRGLKAADAGVFWASPDAPLSGGTGHTIQVCLSQNVPVILQATWRAWLT
jgi:hypothetical protein